MPSSIARRVSKSCAFGRLICPILASRMSILDPFVQLPPTNVWGHKHNSSDLRGRFALTDELAANCTKGAHPFSLWVCPSFALRRPGRFSRNARAKVAAFLWSPFAVHRFILIFFSRVAFPSPAVAEPKTERTPKRRRLFRHQSQQHIPFIHLHKCTALQHNRRTNERMDAENWGKRRMDGEFTAGRPSGLSSANWRTDQTINSR
ncbi:hypothetical protein niasHT_008133 [Heterodera trifolii]|uniref:Uncharacterized protein n=1 Tax=Heterodera trifolii TaxID=157864 RepID=A0ABD2M017_9BILA